MSAEQMHDGPLVRDEWNNIKVAGTRENLCLTGVSISCGPQRPSMKRLRRDWGGQGACLCVSPGKRGIEFVEVIR